MIADFLLAGTTYRILNGGPSYKLDAACSIAVTTVDQAETDRIWNGLIADGGSTGQS